MRRGFDPTVARFDHDVVTLLLQVLGEGRPVYLCSETHPEPFVSAVAAHLGVFTAWAAAPGGKSPAAPREELPPLLNQGFDYIGSADGGVARLASRRVARPRRSSRRRPAPRQPAQLARDCSGCINTPRTRWCWCRS